MSVLKLSLQNIKAKPLYSLLSVLILALSIALLLGIRQLKASFKNQISTHIGAIDLVVGAKGSPLQLVLASVLHLDNPTGNIPYQEAKKISHTPMVKYAVPISYGDNYKGFRIVGTTPEFITIYNAELQQGRPVKQALEVVLGHSVAQQLQIKIGDNILSAHGLIDNDLDIHHDALTVVGILKPTKKVIDRLIVTNLESVWEVHDHEEGEHHEHDAHQDVISSLENDKEITALLVKFKSPRALLTLPRKINTQTNMMAALPKFELNKLFELTSIGFKTITYLAYTILVISCLIIFMSLYKMVKERAFDLAMLRTYGASNLQLIIMLIIEGLILALSAFLLGFLALKFGLKLWSYTASSNLNTLILESLPIQEILQIAAMMLGVVLVSVCLAIVPIIKMNISTILSHEK